MSAHDEAVNEAVRHLANEWKIYLSPREARAFRDAYLAHMAAAGWKLTPREMTEAMKHAVRVNGGNQAVAWLLAAWPDAHDAAPSPEKAP